MAALTRYSINKTKYLLDPEVERLDALLKSHLDRDTRNCLLIQVGLRTGARAQELLNLRRSDLNAYDKTVFIRGLKNSNDREIPLPDALFERLQRWADGVSTNEIFAISYPRLQQIWQLYRPVPKKFHSLRHTFAIRLYRKTKDLRLVQVALGHRNIANTMVYADYVYTQDELRKLIL